MIAFVGSWAVAVLLVVRWIHIVAKNRVWSENAFIESVGAEPRLFIVD